MLSETNPTVIRTRLTVWVKCETVPPNDGSNGISHSTTLELFLVPH